MMQCTKDKGDNELPYVSHLHRIRTLDSASAQWSVLKFRQPVRTPFLTTNGIR